MLNNINRKTFFLLGFLLLCLLQVINAYSSSLFVDEAFYWLEGQHLAWSYSEVPGLIPWTLAAAEWLLPHDPFWVRLPTLIMAALIPWMGMYLASLAGLKQEQTWLTGLLLISLPLLGITGTLAIADIWIIGFTLLAFIFLKLSSIKNQNSNLLMLGLILAIGINIHIRFWLIILIACLVIFWQFKNQKEFIFSLLKITFPIMLLGFIPILVFNIQNDFPLLAFQLKDRHPWEFQPNHFNFFLVQIAITTPLLFILCLKSIKNSEATTEPSENLGYLLSRTAVIHWLIYALLGFFSDTLRLNIHWTLVSYVLLLIAASLSHQHLKLKTWAIITGFITNICLLSTLVYWQNFQNPKSMLNARVTQNAIGWQILSENTKLLLTENESTSILTDNFMTLAQLQYYSKGSMQLKSIPHPLNTKHGRDKQLKIMSLFQKKTSNPHILLVEHTALKLEQQIPFYLNACKHLNGMKLIDSLDLYQGLKTYHYFQTGNGKCQIPPIIYHEINDNQISGWIIKEIGKSLTIQKVNNWATSIELIKTNLSGINSNELFKLLDPNKYHLKQFEFTTDKENRSEPLQLSINAEQIRVLSHRLN